MNWSQNRLAFLVAVLLVVASALYAVGTAIEHSQRTEHHAAQNNAERQLASASANTGETPAERKSETSTSSESSGETAHETTTAKTATIGTTPKTATVETTPESTTPAPAASETGGETGGEIHSEKIAGIDPESWPLVGIVIAISLLVAAGVYWRRGRWFVAAIVLGVVFAAADTRELVHQLQESRTTVATIAGILIALHLLAAFAAAAAMRATGQRTSTIRVS